MQYSTLFKTLKMRILVIFLSSIFVLQSCQFFENKESDDITSEATIKNLPKFNKDLAYQYIEKQISFGPRVPSSSGHQNCAAWILSILKEGTDTAYFQEFETTTYDQKKHKGKNIIAKINPSNPVRIMLSAH
jgi:hypothetical protein